jgi:Bromodomain
MPANGLPAAACHITQSSHNAAPKTSKAPKATTSEAHLQRRELAPAPKPAPPPKAPRTAAAPTRAPAAAPPAPQKPVARVAGARMQPDTKRKLRTILEVLIAEDKFKTFQKPVKKSLAPDYYDIVKEPMHLRTVRSKLEKGDYSNEHEFARVRTHVDDVNAAACWRSDWCCTAPSGLRHSQQRLRAQ